MKKIIHYTIALSGLFLGNVVFAQQGLHCGTDEAMKYVISNNPEVKSRLDAIKTEAEKADKEAYISGYKNENTFNQKGNGNNSVSTTVYTIPVVFHILHVGGSENISNAQCIDAVRIMNRDYAKMNADTTVTIAQFKGIAGTPNIQFALATIDPNGNCTNGINRHYDVNTNWTQNNFGAYAYTWDPRKYLNVYVVKSIAASGGFQAAAYTYLPGTFSAGNSADCIVSLYTYVGSIGASNLTDSRTLTHETGHWLNLQHPWGNNNGAGVTCGDDGVTDTPITKGHLSCVLTSAVCTNGVVENVQNYMDYSYCTTMFTNGQVTRMRNTIINNTGNVGRSTIIGAVNLAATGVTSPIVCAPTVGFTANKTIVCAGSTVTFQDSTLNTHVTSWNWSFPGGIPATSTDSIPVITYNTTGTYAVSYTATNSAGDSTLTRSNYITVMANTATYQNQLSESFETITIPNANWAVSNATNGGINWSHNNTTGNTGTHSVELANLGNTAGSSSTLYTPSFNISNIYQASSSTKFNFSVAYQQQTSTSADKLQIFSSTDCGQSWISRYAKSGATLATTTPSTTNFVPTAAEWRTEQVNINAVINSTNVLFKFVFTADPTTPGNNIYIDDINLPASTTGIKTLTANELNLQVYPNPAAHASTLSFELAEKHTTSIYVTNVLGSVVEKIISAPLAAGSYAYAIGETTNLSSGVYFINMTIDGNLLTKKLIIQ